MSGPRTPVSEAGAPALGPAGEPCEQCGAPLAADQRYCLNCGRRRGGPRVDYRREGIGDAGASPPPAADSPVTPEPEPAGEARGQRDYAPLAAVGGIAVLGLMLLIGVLIGKGDGWTAPAPAPVVVQGAASGAEAGGDKGGGGGDGAAGDSGLGISSGGGKPKSKQKGGEEKRPPIRARSRPARATSPNSKTKPAKTRRKRR